MLSKKERQAYLKELGFYNGAIDGIIGEKTKAAYRSLQNRYFTRVEDKDGKYGTNTDILLQNAYNTHLYCKDFTLDEFKCQCGGKYCTGYPKVLNVHLLQNVQQVRNKFGTTVITSGLRCSKHNSAVGGSWNSRHKSGKALDVRTIRDSSESGRRALMEYWRTLPNQRYTYCNINGSNPNMGRSVHIDVK